MKIFGCILISAFIYLTVAKYRGHGFDRYGTEDIWYSPPIPYMSPLALTSVYGINSPVSIPYIDRYERRWGMSTPRRDARRITRASLVSRWSRTSRNRPAQG